MLRCRSRMARKGLCSLMGGGDLEREYRELWRRPMGLGGLVGHTRRIHVRTSLNLATKVPLVVDDEICRVFQRMFVSSNNVSVATTVQGPSVFSLKFHPKRSMPESEGLMPS
jgi:hypothetical protein